MSTPGPVIGYGIDGMPESLLERLFDADSMPYIESLMEDGAAGPLNSTLPAITPCAFSGLQTGLNPGHYGIFEFMSWEPETGKMDWTNSTKLPTTLFDYLSAAGMSVGSVNVPVTYPPRELNGFQVTGLLTPSREYQYTYPETIGELIEADFPGYHIFNLRNMKEGDPHGEFEQYVDSLVDVVSTRVDLAETLLREYGVPDLFLIHFQSADVVQHVLWPYIDPNDPHGLYDPAKEAYIFANFYRAIDDGISRLSEAVTQTGEPLEIVFSDHGFQPHKKRINLGNWLEGHGYLHLENPPSPRPAELDPKYYDWEASTAVSVSRSHEGFIYCLSDCEKLLQKSLGELRDPDTGEQVVKTIHRATDVYTGPCVEQLPDLIIEPSPEYSFTGEPTPDNDLIYDVTPETDFVLGKHSSTGVIGINGPKISSSTKLDAQLFDIAPTILAYLGVDVDRDFDGDELDGIPTASPTHCVTQHNTTTSRNLSNDEQELLQERLQLLGYSS